MTSKTHFAALAVTLALAGCVTGQTTSFAPKSGQMALIRDGRPSIQSTKSRTVVVLAPAARQAPLGARPTLVVAIQNRANAPVTFRLADVSATQTGGPADGQALKVFTYDELVAEERGRQIAAAILVGVAAGANSAAAANSSRNPYIANWNTQIAAQQNADMAANAAVRGEINLAVLEKTIIKDDTLMPGEWYGGILQIQAPATTDVAAPTSFVLDLDVGGEHHVFDVSQNPIKG